MAENFASQTVDYSGCTLLSPENSSKILDRLVERNKKTKTITDKFIMTSERPLDAINIFTPLDGVKTGRIISLDINISSTMVATATVLVEEDYKDYAYCGEVLTGE